MFLPSKLTSLPLRLGLCHRNSSVSNCFPPDGTDAPRFVLTHIHIFLENRDFSVRNLIRSSFEALPDQRFATGKLPVTWMFSFFEQSNQQGKLNECFSREIQMGIKKYLGIFQTILNVFGKFRSSKFFRVFVFPVM